MRQDKKQKDKTAVALVLCFCLIALVSIFVVKANIDKFKDNMQVNKAADVVKEKAVDEDKETDIKIIDSKNNPDSDADNSNSAANPKFIVPVNGEIIMDYSMDMPIYWKTLDQYMTHNGLDISAPMGTSIKACADGTVTKVDEDDKLGITVEINHGNNLISVYGNLSKKDLVELGEVVSAGTPIGKIGQTSMFEFEEDEHLHFAMRKNDEPTDPRNYIKGF